MRKIEEFDFESVPDTLQSQYSASPGIAGLVAYFEELLPTQGIMLFEDKIFNIYTAEGMGLDIWGRILGIGRIIKVDSAEFFGFEGSDEQNFDAAPFEYEAATENFILEDEPFRRYLLLTKAFANIASAEAPQLNYILGQLFPEKEVFVINVGVMKIRFVFGFVLSDLEQSIFDLGLLTRGAGVGYEYYMRLDDESFGFEGSDAQNFDNGIFEPYGVIEIK